MVKKLYALKSKTQIIEIADVIFRKVFRKKPGYDRGLGNTRILESSHTMLGSDENATILS